MDYFELQEGVKNFLINNYGNYLISLNLKKDGSGGFDFKMSLPEKLEEKELKKFPIKMEDFLNKYFNLKIEIDNSPNNWFLKENFWTLQRQMDSVIDYILDKKMPQFENVWKIKYCISHSKMMLDNSDTFNDCIKNFEEK
jgi:hypothetical protein